MEQVPVMLSTKDLSYICDMFNWNFTTAKTAMSFSKEVQNEEIKEFLQNTYEIHKSICESLLNFLKGENNEQ